MNDRNRPILLMTPAAIAGFFLTIPLLALLLRTPWAGMPRVVATNEVRTALLLSLVTSTAASVLAACLGIPLAWYLASRNASWIGWLRAAVTVPLVLPPVVGGIALLMAFGREGVIGQWLYAATGLSLPFTTTAVVLAQLFVAMPFLVITVEGALRSRDGHLEEAAATLGASRWATFRMVTLPSIFPAIGAGLALTWARALGEFGATVTFAGSFPERTETMPLAAYLALQTDPDAALALSVLLLVAAVLMLVLLRRQLVGAVT